MESDVFNPHASGTGCEPQCSAGYQLVKRLSCLWLCLCGICLFADPIAIDDPIELLVEDAADLVVQNQYTEQEQYNSALNLYLSSTPFARIQARVSGKHIRILGSTKALAEAATANLQIRYQDNLALGHYRMQWADGLILSQSQKHPGILSPSHPDSYCPQGLALNLYHKPVRLMAFISRQKRKVKLLEQQISLLPRSKKDYLGSTLEEIYGVALSMQTEQFSLGALQYYQSYDRSFSDPALDSLLVATSLAASYHSPRHILRAECAIQDQASLALSWQMRSSGFQQKWQYRRLNRYQRPAYASKVLRLNNQEQRDELSAELKYSLQLPITLTLRSTLNKAYADVAQTGWLGEHKAAIAYDDTQSSLYLSLIGIDRDILSAVDSTFINSNPQHYRFYLKLGQQINTHISTSLAFRYHHQDEILALKTGSWWQQSLKYSNANTCLQLSFSIWNSGNYTLMIPDDSESGFQSKGKNSAALSLRAEQSWKNLSAQLVMEQDLKGSQDTSLRMNLAAHFH